MAALNRVQLIGRLGRDPEARYTPTGKKVAHFSLAVSNRWRSRDGEMNESTEWVNIEAWERLGEVSQEFLRKGNLVYLEGRLKTDKYEENGEPRYFTKVVVSALEFLDRKNTEEEMVTDREAPAEEEVAEFPF